MWFDFRMEFTKGELMEKKKRWHLRVLYFGMLLLAVILNGHGVAAETNEQEDDEKGNSFTYYLDKNNGCLTVTGNGEMENIKTTVQSDGDISVSRPWGMTQAECKKIKRIVVGDGITQIAEGAFAKLPNVTNVQLPQSLEMVGDYAFYQCSSLKSISIPERTLAIGMYSFYGCSKLMQVDIGERFNKLGDYAFYGCTSLCKMNVDTLNENFVMKADTLYSRNKKTAYQYLVGISGSAKLVSGVTRIQKGAFAYGRFTTIKMPKSLKTVGADAFSNCKKLKKLTLSSGVRTIGSRAFYHCTKLRNVAVSGKVKKIGTRALGYCLKKKMTAKGDAVWSVGRMKKFTIKVTKNSAAWKYAKRNKIAYQVR